MTDPVDTDALRTRAELLDKWLDREALRMAAAELDRLRTLIDDAPHSQACHVGRQCECWKAHKL